MNNISSGKLELIIGNMFSGKSTELIRRINKEKSINKKVLVINYFHDNRYSNNSISTHDNGKIRCLKLEKLEEISQDIINNFDTFFIDEGQFFLDLYVIVSKLVDIHKKHIIVSGLDGDYNRNMFGQIIKLIPICDTVDKLTAYCSKCSNGNSAPFTKKCNSTGNNSTGNNSTGNNSVVEIGGSEKYIPVCRYHYFNN